MMGIKTLLVMVIFLSFVGESYATASYEAISYMRVGFSQLWDSYNYDDGKDVSGVGQHDEYSTIQGGSSEDDSWISVGAAVYGSAGDGTGTLSGTSLEKYTRDAQVFFSFPEATSTAFTITLLNSLLDTDSTTDFPGQEDASAIAYQAIYLDGGQVLLVNNTFTTSLSGYHSVTLLTHAEGWAEAHYNSVPEPSTIFFLGIGLAGVGLLRRRL